MPRSYHLEARALEHHRDEVLADVVDVALDGADHDLADALGSRLGQQRSEDRHARLHGVRREQHLGHEQDPVAEVDADDPHPLDERVVQHLVGAPTSLEQDVGSLDDLVREPVVEVVVHLRDEIGVGQRLQIEVVVSHRLLPRVPYRGTMLYRGILGDPDDGAIARACIRDPRRGGAATRRRHRHR